MRKSFQFKLFHNERKAKQLRNELYVFCTIHNHCIALIKRHYKLFGKNPAKYTLQKHLKKLMDRGNRPSWKALGYSQAIQEVTDRIYKSYQAFFASCKKGSGTKKSSPPKFKSFRKYKSFTLKQAGWKLDEAKCIVTIGKHQYRYNNSRDLSGEIKTVTVKIDNVGHWYVILSCDLRETYKPAKVAPMTGKSAGFDFGLLCFLTSSANEKIASGESLKESLDKLKVKSKQLSTKAQGSKNRFKARKALARLHQKISNQRLDFHFKLANSLVHEYDNLFFEDLNLDAMKKLWGRKVSDLGLNQFMQIVDFKAQEHGKSVCKIDRFYPSSKTCSKCTKVKEDLSLKDRIFECECGHKIDRDLNAAINILAVGASTVGLDGVTRERALAAVV